eukprot:TRINITY_DN6426_c0_g2_i1.p1 TRINITY_DN6426_c0_g2~~TRINITY_DN6426_c0_g2_i1.p1  ORF type:complete len:334 (-),score=55.42 TRINITY_DN6426_c0_g2_i1:388-1389(-)
MSKMSGVKFLSGLSGSEIRSVYVALFYGLSSLSMNFLNKVVVSSYGFNYPSFIMFAQTLLTTLLLKSGKGLSVFQLRSYSREAAYDLLIPSLAHVLHSTLSLIALKGMNIPMYAALKRCTPLVNLALTVILLKKARPSTSILVSILSITLGCLIAGIGDYDFDMYTYCIGLMSVFAQGLYLTSIQKTHGEKNSVVDMLYINSRNTLPVFMFMSCALLEPLVIWENRTHFYSKGFLLSITTLSLAGSVLVYSQFLCTTICSALTTSLVGVAKSVFQTILGLFTFGGIHYNPINVLGLSMNLFGGIVYTYVKHKENTAHLLQTSNTPTPYSSGKT